MGEYKHVIQHL